MTRASYRYRTYALVPDTEPDAEPHSYAAQCAVCEESGPRGEDAAEAQSWVIGHLRAHPEHFSYREVITRPYRAEPREWR